MKKFPLALLASCLILIFVASCGMDDDNTWDDYRQWREDNEAWFMEQQNRTNDDGSMYYEALYPVWDPAQYILIHYFNDRELTKDNLSPMLTSTVDVKYIGRLYNDEVFDSSYTMTASYGDSIYRTKCSNVITGWQIALGDMHVGDSCEIIIPYRLAYGSSETGSIKPYSALKFNVKLVDIPYYEINN